MTVDTTWMNKHVTTVEGIEGHWAKVEGGKGSSTVTKSWDGGATEPDIGTSRPEYSDLTVTRPFKRLRDAGVASRLRPQIGRRVSTITRFYTDNDDIVTSDKTTWHGVLIAVNDPDSDAESSAAMTISLVFAVNKVT
jgi:hypothetical protein